MSCSYNAQGDFACKANDRTDKRGVPIKLNNKHIETYAADPEQVDIENMRRCIVIDELKRFTNYSWGGDMAWYARVDCPDHLTNSSSELMKAGYLKFAEAPPTQLSNRQLNDINTRWTEKLRNKEQLDVMYVDSLRTKKMLDVLM